MNATDDLVQAVLAALRTVHGLRPSTPSTVPAASWIPWDLDTLAVNVAKDVVRIQVVATQLPLPASLRQAAQAIRPVLSGTPWADARLQLVVTDVDRAAFKRDGPHTIGP